MRAWAWVVRVLLSACAFACCTLPLQAQLPRSLQKCLPYPTFQQEIEEMSPDVNADPNEPPGPEHPQAQIVSIRFYGARSVPMAEKEKIAEKVESERFYFNSKADLEDQVEYIVEWNWEDAGYFGTKAQVTVEKAGPDGETSPFVAIAFVQESGKYRVGSVSIRSADPDERLVFPVQELRQLFPAREGDIICTTAIRDWLEGLRHLYWKDGYIDSTSEPRMDVDPRRGVIDFTMVLDQGKQFRVSSLEVITENPQLEQALRRGVRVGDVFNSAAWDQLLESNKKLLPEGFSPGDVEFHRNVKAGTVQIIVDALTCPESSDLK